MQLQAQPNYMVPERNLFFQGALATRELYENSGYFNITQKISNGAELLNLNDKGTAGINKDFPSFKFGTILEAMGSKVDSPNIIHSKKTLFCKNMQI